MRLIPVYGCVGYLYNSETGEVVKLVRGKKKPVNTFFVNGEECLTLPNGKSVRLKSLLHRRDR